MNVPNLSTHDKTLAINLHPAQYGTFAAIGAGQEVARWFFHGGGATATVARSISAYDMVMSTATYGPAARYVSRQRLQAMLEYEFRLLLTQLDVVRGERSTFFVVANVEVYVYPALDPTSGAVTTAVMLEVEPQFRQLKAFLLENQYVEPLNNYSKAYRPIVTREVLAKLQRGDSSWEALAPPRIVQIIRQNKLFGYQSPSERCRRRV